MASEDLVTVTNNENPSINLEITSYNNNINLSFIQSIEAVIAAHNTSENAHLNIQNTLESEIALKANSTEVSSALALKVDKITGKELSTNDLTNALKSNYDTAYTNNHTHNNKAILDALINNGSGASFLSDDGTYKSVSAFTADTSNLPTLSNNSSDANNDIDFSAGFCYDTGTFAKITSSAKTKRLDASFAAGTNQGGLDTGSKANSTWYAVFAISKNDGTSDFLFSTSSTAPTMPSGYTNKRRIGWIKTDSSGNIIGFYQKGDFITYNSNITDYTSSSTVTGYSLTLSVPSGVRAMLICEYVASGTSWGNMLLYDLNNQSGHHAFNVAAGAHAANSVDINVNNISQIGLTTVSSSGTFSIITMGYIDLRGKK